MNQSHNGNRNTMENWASLIEYKLLYFTVFAGMGILMPYLPVFFQSLGLSKGEIGVLCMIPKLCSFLVAPIFSMIGDMYHAHYELMMISLIFSTISVLLMIFSFSFQLLSVIILLGSMMRAPLTPQIDALVMSVLSNKTLYGRIRLWGAVSFGIFSLIGGLYASPTPHLQGAGGKDSTFVDIGFRIIFYIHSFCSFMSGLVLLYLMNQKQTNNFLTTFRDQSTLPEQQKSNQESVDSKGSAKEKVPVLVALSRVFTDHPEVGAFSIIVLLSGFGGGVIDSFLFLRLSQLGGSGLVMGISRFITCAAEVPMFQISGKLQERLGVWPTLAITQLTFVIRFIYYAFLTEPWYVLPCEVLHGFTFAVMWSVSSAYASEISPPECHSTLQTILKGWHLGFGSGLGALIGGFVYDQFGAVWLFKVSALLSFFSLLLALVMSGRHSAEQSTHPKQDEYSALHQKDIELAAVTQKGEI